MKKIKGYWTDLHSNKWDCNIYSKQEAKKFSNSLINCQNCTNCRNCWNCRDCRDCQYCQYCWNCRDCQDCQDCQDCWNCWDCQNCWNCWDCQDCQDCQDCKENPERIVSPKIGSRVKQTIVYFNRTGFDFVICGCFVGTFEMFKKRVKDTYPNKNNIYRKEYDLFIKKVERYKQT